MAEAHNGKTMYELKETVNTRAPGMWEQIYHAVNIDVIKTVADWGCGYGDVLSAFYESGVEVCYAIDFEVDDFVYGSMIRGQSWRDYILVQVDFDLVLPPIRS